MPRRSAAWDHDHDDGNDDDRRPWDDDDAFPRQHDLDVHDDPDDGHGPDQLYDARTLLVDNDVHDLTADDDVDHLPANDHPV